MMDGRYLGLLDMLDGGGAGRAGQTFEGGPLSGLLNALGIRPMGYMERLRQQQPTMRPAGLGVAPTPSPAPVTTQPLIGNLTPQDIMAAIDRGVRPPYRQPQVQPQRMPTLQELMEYDRMKREMAATAGLFGDPFDPFRPM